MIVLSGCTEQPGELEILTRKKTGKSEGAVTWIRAVRKQRMLFYSDKTKLLTMWPPSWTSYPHSVLCMHPCTSQATEPIQINRHGFAALRFASHHDADWLFGPNYPHFSQSSAKSSADYAYSYISAIHYRPPPQKKSLRSLAKKENTGKFW